MVALRNQSRALAFNIPMCLDISLLIYNGNAVAPSIPKMALKLISLTLNFLIDPLQQVIDTLPTGCVCFGLGSREEKKSFSITTVLNLVVSLYTIVHFACI
jgi:hypothetical protein